MSRTKLPVAFPVASLVLLRAVEDDFAARTPRQLVSLVTDCANYFRTRSNVVTELTECLRTTIRSGPGHVSMFTPTPPRRLSSSTTFLSMRKVTASAPPVALLALEWLPAMSYVTSRLQMRVHVCSSNTNITSISSTPYHGGRITWCAQFGQTTPTFSLRLSKCAVYQLWNMGRYS